MIAFSEQRVAIVGALLAVQREIQPVVKDRQNTHTQSKYATLDAITDYLRPLLAKHGLLLMQSGERDEGGMKITTVVQHESGEWAQASVYVPLVGQALKGGGYGPVSPQSAGSATTYGRRYGLSLMFAITTDEDDDGQRGSTTQRKAALRESRESKAANDAGAKNLHDYPLPGFKGLDTYKGKPLKDVPTAVLEDVYKRCEGQSGKLPRATRDAVEQVLEDRRHTETVFGEPSPALAPVADDLPFAR